MSESMPPYDFSEMPAFKKAVAEAISEYFGLSQMSQDGADLLRVEKIAAAADSANYMHSRMPPSISQFKGSGNLLEYCMKLPRLEGQILEFGVFSGRTLNLIASYTSQTIYGFDGFQGLPEDWRPDIKMGAFRKAELPEVKSNAELVVGWFDDTLPGFVAQHPEPISLLHIDCDLYSSTRTIFHFFAKQIVSGTIISFDEYFNYVGWRNHEFKAFQEFIASSGHSYRYIGVVPRSQQVAVQIL